MATPRLMGAEVKRKEDPRLITGTSSYVGDLALPGMHYVAFVRISLPVTTLKTPGRRSAGATSIRRMRA